MRRTRLTGIVTRIVLVLVGRRGARGTGLWSGRRRRIRGGSGLGRRGAVRRRFRLCLVGVVRDGGTER